MLIYVLTKFKFTFIPYPSPQIDLKECLTQNKTLAHQYRLKQQEHLKVKEKFLDGLEGRISLESSLKDHKQVQKLTKTTTKASSLNLSVASVVSFLAFHLDHGSNPISD